ncbi:AT-hook motif nuclear-localized protein 3-like [Spinacia oleracea]|uniref:AT-hook motif nuclear-localized protein n=1 Tax=Spinacia oleracea TaxID=3562 RepID=A0ABM3QWI1_SPIOL|nr:AT-hook motif nuclear-localized protein 3-like [Spinacia oleracea]
MVGGPRSRAGGLSVYLAGPDGRVLGGGVAGVLIAASPVQIESLPQMVDGVCSDDGNAQLEATTHFRKLLSIGSYLMFSICIGLWEYVYKHLTLRKR